MTNLPIKSFPDKNTHKIKISNKQNSFYTRRNANSDSEVISSLRDDDEIILLEQGVGDDCQWHYIKHNQTFSFLKKEKGYNLEKLPNSDYVYLDYECIKKDKKNILSIIEIDWTEKEINKPYYNKQDTKWYIPYDTGFPSTGGENLIPRLKNSRKEAARIILSDLGIDSSDQYLDMVISAIGVIAVEDYHVSDKYLENMKALISIEEKYLKKMQKAKNAIPDGIKKIILYTSGDSSFLNKIGNVVKYFHVWDRQISNSEINLNIDLTKEAKRLNKFIATLNILLGKNNLNLNSINSLEYVVDLDYKPQSISYEINNTYEPIKIGFDSFIDSEPNDSQRTIKYLFHLNEIENDYNQKITWSEFLQKYTDFPLINISPSSLKKKKGNILSKVDSAINELNIARSMSIDGRHKIRAIKKSLKSSSELAKEEKIFLNNEIRQEVANYAINAVDNVEDQIIANLTNIIEEITGVDQAFEKILGKIELKDIVHSLTGLDLIKDLKESEEEESIEEDVPKDAVMFVGDPELPLGQLRPFIEEEQFKNLIEREIVIPTIGKSKIKNILLSLSEEYEKGSKNSIYDFFSYDFDTSLAGPTGSAGGSPSERTNTVKYNKDEIFKIEINVDGFGKIKIEQLYKIVLNTEIDITAFKAPTSAPKVAWKIISLYPQYKKQILLNNKLSTYDIESIESLFKRNTLPKVGTVKISDEYPTIDENKGFSKIIYNTMIDYFNDIFVTLIKEFINSLLQIKINVSANSHDDNIISMLKKSNEKKFSSVDQSYKNLDNYISEISKISGIKDGNIKEFNSLFNDISLMLNSAELASLLKGDASDPLLTKVRILIDKRYPKYSKVFNSKTKIKDFMSSIGDIVDSKLIDTINITNNERLSEPSNLDIDMNIVYSKDTSITKEQLDEILEKSRIRKQKKMRYINSVLDTFSTNALQNNNIVEDLFCSKQKGSSISLKDDTFDHMLEMVVRSNLETISMSFDSDINSYHDFMISNIRKNEIIDAVIYRNGKLTWNPEIKRMEAQGYDLPFDTGFGKEPLARNKKVTKETTMKVVCPYAKKNLSNLEYTDSFNTRMDDSGVYYELTLVPDHESIKKMADGLKSLVEVEEDKIELNYEELIKSYPIWKIRYKNLWDKGSIDDIENEIFQIEIYSQIMQTNGDNPAQTEPYLISRIEKKLPLSIKRYISRLISLNNFSNLGIAINTEVNDPNNSSSISLQEALNPNFSGTTRVITENHNNTTIVRVYASYSALCPPNANLLVHEFHFDREFDPLISPQQALREAMNLSGKERCEYIISYMAIPEVWNILRPLYESSSCADSLLGTEQNTNKIPLQYSVFGLYVKNILREHFTRDNNGRLLDEHKKYLDEIYEYYSRAVQPNIANDLMSLLAKQISNSLLFFDSESAKNNKDPQKSGIKTNSTLLEKINFNRKQNSFEKICNINPDILSLDKMVKKAQINFEKNGGFCSLIDGLEDEDLNEEKNGYDNPVNKSLIDIVIDLTIKIYVLDYFLRGIFVFSEFSFQNGIDDYVIEFISTNIIDELKKYQSSYYEDIVKVVNNRNLNNDQILSEMDENANLEEEYQKFFKKNLKNMIIREFAVIAFEMKQIFLQDESSPLKNINFNSSFNMHDKMIKDWLPTVELQKENNNRFVSEIQNAIRQENNFNIKNGNLFLEKFYRLIRKYDFSSAVDSLSSMLLDRQDIFNLSVEEQTLKKIINDSLKLAWEENISSAEEYEVYLNIEEMNNKMKSFHDSFVRNILNSSIDGVSIFRQYCFKLIKKYE